MWWQGRIRELEEIRAELAEKELVLLGKEQELLERDQTVQVLREEASQLPLCKPWVPVNLAPLWDLNIKHSGWTFS